MNVLKYFIIICLLIGMTHSSYAATSVPHRVHFQSVFYDSGGNPLTSGQYQARFSILDQSDQPLYTEEQQVELANGVASVMVGDGFKEGSNLSSPAGGIPVDVLNPTQNYFLKVELKGSSELSPLQIASVPFSFYSERALSVSPGSILTESLAQGIIERDHLSKALQDAIFGSIGSDRLPSSVVTKEEFLNHVNAMSGAHRAEAISVTNPAFANSRSTNVGGVLKDLDVALEFRRHDIDTKISKAGDTMTGNLVMQGGNITLSDGATIDGYDISSAFPNLQSQINTKLSLSGGSLSGILDMQGNRIINVEQPQGEWDAATKSYVDWRVSTIESELLALLHPSPSQSVGPPQVVASGIVKGGPVGGQPTFVSGYNIANATNSFSIGGGDTITVQFINPVSPPYIVLVTPIDAVANVASNGSLYAHDMGSSQFLVDHGGNFFGFLPYFNFIVYK